MAHYKGAASEGGRAQILMKKRQKEQEEIETRKRKIEDELKIGSIQNKFASHYDAVEQQLKSNTIGEIFCFQFPRGHTLACQKYFFPIYFFENNTYFKTGFCCYFLSDFGRNLY